MILAQVVGRTWSDRQVPGLASRRLLMVRDMSDGTTRVAVDVLDVGIGGMVLVATDEAAAAACGEAVVDAAIVALVSQHDPVPD